MLVLIPTAGKNSFTSSVPFSAILNLCSTQFHPYPVQSVNNVLKVYTFALNCRNLKCTTVIRCRQIKRAKISTFWECRQNGGRHRLTLSSLVLFLPPHVASSIPLRSASSPPRPDGRGPALEARRVVCLLWTSCQSWSILLYIQIPIQMLWIH